MTKLCTCTLLMAFGFVVMLAASEASMAKRGNVRFGPSTKDGVVCTLNAGATVQVLGNADGSKNWFKIRFPSQGHAWMHSVNLAKTDKERVLRVTTDGAVVRRDATRGADVVTELQRNDTVQWKGPKVGQWYAVYVPNAVAYVHSSVLYFKSEKTTATKTETASSEKVATTTTEPKIKTNPSTGHPTDKIWQSAVKTYEEYRLQLQNDREQALKLDWKGLSNQLNQVIQDHPDLTTRIYAKRLSNVIERVVESAGTASAPAVNEKPADQKQTIVAAKTENTNTQQVVKTETKTEVKTEPVTEEKGPDIAVLKTTHKGVVGWLQDLEVASIGVKYVILGDNGIAAFIKLKDGVDIKLKDLHWQRVHVNGDTKIVDHEVEAQYKGIPLIIVSELKVIK